MAYVYVADRSRCPRQLDVCPWQQPPRYDEDVLAVAEAYFRASRDGALVPAMKGTLDMVLVRRPRPVEDVDLPFEVYVGDGATEPIATTSRLIRIRPTWRSRSGCAGDLAVGHHGERAGDVLLVAHDGDVANPRLRYYFSKAYRSWHGSPSRTDSDVPLIVANRGHRARTSARRCAASSASDRSSSGSPT